MHSDNGACGINAPEKSFNTSELLALQQGENKLLRRFL
jgi:hypothetical protein